MLGAIAGDIIGSEYEFSAKREKTKDFPIFEDTKEEKDFTDDTVLTVATAEVILKGKDELGYAKAYRDYGRRYKDRGYGGGFLIWISDKGINPPYESWGNGAAMRAAPIGWAYDTITETISEACESAKVTHNHIEGIKGAKAVAVAIYLARTGFTKEQIRVTIQNIFNYDLRRTCDDIRPDYEFDVSCQGSVPESIIAFLDSTDYEDAVRNAVSLGGDTDTMACIAGSIAEAFYGEIPAYIEANVRTKLDKKLIKIMDEFRDRYNNDIKK